MPARPGMPAITQLDQALRRVVEPLHDIIGRITGQTLVKVRRVEGEVKDDIAFLDPAAVLAPDTIDKVNEIITKLGEVIALLDKIHAKQTEIIKRLQED